MTMKWDVKENNKDCRFVIYISVSLYADRGIFFKKGG
jgi:hypothetical protein